jgi:pyrimidine-specific ribonucleoside hydrolase
MKRTIIIDCDPGIDDALAILMALAAPDELDIAGITTVGGNVGIAETTRNALALVTLAGRRVPVAKGADNPLVVPKSRAVSVHGADGLGGVRLPEPVWPLEKASAWEFIRGTADRLDGQLELVAIGPLTNVAIALAAYPRLTRSIRAIHLMGGSAGLGNMTPAAEFNTFVDPHAAAAVFQSGIPIAMYGLDVTSRASLSAPALKELRTIGGRILTPVCSMLDYYMGVYRTFKRDTLALHDPLVIANLIDPSIVELKPYYVAVETNGEFTAGKTVVDVHNTLRRPPNTRVGVDLDAAKFLGLMERLLRSYDQAADRPALLKKGTGNRES